MTPPGWLAVLILLLPHAYLALFLVSLLLLVIVRNRLLVAALGGLLVSAAVLWGALLIPRKVTPPPNGTVLRTMVWNVQRMKGIPGTTSSTENGESCVVNLISRERPDLLALLEISRTQLDRLQVELDLGPDQCLWTDYFGTGRSSFGGLAICVPHSGSQLSITGRRSLELPPGWKYLFAELHDTHEGKDQTFNFLAIHIAPPQVTDADVAEALSDIRKGKTDGLRQAWGLFQQYEERVSLQGVQAISALQRISGFQDPTLLAGDFNTTQDAALHRRLRESLTDTWLTAGFGFGATRRWGGFLPLRIDYIYSTQEFAVEESQTLNSGCSDHLPVVSSVFLKPEGKEPGQE